MSHPCDNVLRAITACRINGEDGIFLLHAVPIEGGYRIVRDWGESEEHMEMGITPLRYVDLSAGQCQVVESADEPFEIACSIPQDVLWITADHS